MRTCLIWLVLSAVAYCQPVAKIVGPSVAPPGELVVLSSTGSVGDNLVWVRPDSLQTVQAGCTLLDTQVFFATTKVGKYEFLLLAADKEARIAYAKHVVEIKAGGSTPVDPKPEPEQPPTPNPAKWSKLVDVSKAGADAIKDEPTRAKLKAALAAVILIVDAKCKEGVCPTVAEAKQMVLKAIESVLITRQGASALIDWTMWRRGNQAELDRLGLTDLQDYVSAVKAIASGL